MGITCEFCHGEIDPGAQRCVVCAAPVPGASPPAPTATRVLGFSRGSVFDQKYVIVERLGQGGFADVYRVFHPMLQREFALKMLHAGLAVDPGVRERFFREARVLMDLTHPNIVTVRDVAQHQGIVYMVMDLCPGETLEALLLREGRLPGAEAIGLGLTVLDALEVAHRKGVVHRDLKPANLMVSHGPGGRLDVHILDFGIAKLLDPPPGDEGTLTGAMVIGTPQYMSPEQAQGEPVDARTDLYSLGVILYHAVTGKRPFGGAHGSEVIRRLLRDPVPAFADHGVADEPPGLEATLREVMSKDRTQRPASARVMRRMLEALLRRPAPEPAPAEAEPEPVRPEQPAVLPPPPCGLQAAPLVLTDSRWTAPAPGDGQIVFGCACGRKVTVRDVHAGHPGWCPHCWHALRVPVPTRREPNRTTYFANCSRCRDVVELGHTDATTRVLCPSCSIAHRVRK